MRKRLHRASGMQALHIPVGMGAFAAGIVLLAVPVLAAVASATPSARAPWLGLLGGVALIVYGATKGVGDVS